jgi:oligosaccharyltransferase complex subunit alpha (ribophorin I)
MAIPKRWRTFSFLFLSLIASSLASPQSFENTAVVRSVELGGAVVHVTTTYAIKAIEAGAKVYTIALGLEEKEKTSWFEVKVKGQHTPLSISEHPYALEATKYVQFELCRHASH